MYREVVIRIKPPPHSWVLSTRDIGYVNVRVFDCRPINSHRVNEFFD